MKILLLNITFKISNCSQNHIIVGFKLTVHRYDPIWNTEYRIRNPDPPFFLALNVKTLSTRLLT